MVKCARVRSSFFFIQNATRITLQQFSRRSGCDLILICSCWICFLVKIHKQKTKTKQNKTKQKTNKIKKTKTKKKTNKQTNKQNKKQNKPKKIIQKPSTRLHYSSKEMRILKVICVHKISSYFMHAPINGNFQHVCCFNMLTYNIVSVFVIFLKNFYLFF